jgi:hypothetical protein
MLHCTFVLLLGVQQNECRKNFTSPKSKTALRSVVSERRQLEAKARKIVAASLPGQEAVMSRSASRAVRIAKHFLPDHINADYLNKIFRKCL